MYNAIIMKLETQCVFIGHEYHAQCDVTLVMQYENKRSMGHISHLNHLDQHIFVCKF